MLFRSEQYLCAGKFKETCSDFKTCTNCQLTLGEDCRAPWEPSDCLIKGPLDVLMHPVFQRFQRRRGEAAPQGKIYGMWKNDQQAERWVKGQVKAKTKPKPIPLAQPKAKKITVVRAPKAQRNARFPVPPAVEQAPAPGQPAQFGAPLVQEKFCTKKRNKEVEQQRYTIKELRQLGKERGIPKAFHMPYEQLCIELGFQVD